MTLALAALVSVTLALAALKNLGVACSAVCSHQLESEMVKKQPTVKLVKKQLRPGAAPLATAKKGDTVTDFVFQDNQDCTCTVYGTDASGNRVDIATVASLTPPPTSSDTAVITVAPPSGMTFAMHAVGPLTTPGTPVNITATATWTDGTVGPFTFTLPVDVISGGPTGIEIVPGTPTVH